jgi:hypothetical protein
MKQRKHYRKFYGANASLWIQNREYSCIVKDISRSGALLTFDVLPLLKIGELVDIQIPFTDGERHVKKTAKVKRLNGNSIGIRFYGNSQAKVHEIEDTICPTGSITRNRHLLDSNG